MTVKLKVSVVDNRMTLRNKEIVQTKENVKYYLTLTNIIQQNFQVKNLSKVIIVLSFDTELKIKKNFLDEKSTRLKRIL